MFSLDVLNAVADVVIRAHIGSFELWSYLMGWGGGSNLVTDGFLCVPWCVFEAMHFIISLCISV